MDTKVKGRGRPAGSRNKEPFRYVLLSDLRELLKDTSVIPVKAEFIDELMAYRDVVPEDLSGTITSEKISVMPDSLLKKIGI